LIKDHGVSRPLHLESVTGRNIFALGNDDASGQIFQRYSPIVGVEEGPCPESLLVDITGCAACFHGEDRLRQLLARVGDFVEAALAVRPAAPVRFTAVG